MIRTDSQIGEKTFRQADKRIDREMEIGRQTDIRTDGRIAGQTDEQRNGQV